MFQTVFISGRARALRCFRLFLLAAGREPSGVSGCFSGDDTGRLAPFRYKVDTGRLAPFRYKDDTRRLTPFRYKDDTGRLAPFRLNRRLFWDDSLSLRRFLRQAVGGDVIVWIFGDIDFHQVTGAIQQRLTFQTEVS